MIRSSLVAAALLLLAGCGDAAPRSDATLVAVVDGDTIRVHADGVVESVRLVGVNTPEQSECWAAEAKEALRALVTAAPLRLAAAGSDDRDRFGRLLRYVYAGDVLVNLAMVRRGHGVALGRDHPLAAAFGEAADEAWEAGAGLWGREACGPSAIEPVRIEAVHPDPPGDDSARPNDETVVLRNTGRDGADVAGWRLRDESSSNRLILPRGLVIAPGDMLTIHSGCGQDDRSDVYWCAGPVWSNGGDTVILQTPAGTVVDRLVYGP